MAGRIDQRNLAAAIVEDHLRRGACFRARAAVRPPSRDLQGPDHPAKPPGGCADAGQLIRRQGGDTTGSRIYVPSASVTVVPSGSPEIVTRSTCRVPASVSTVSVTWLARSEVEDAVGGLRGTDDDPPAYRSGGPSHAQRAGDARRRRHCHPAQPRRDIQHDRAGVIPRRRKLGRPASWARSTSARRRPAAADRRWRC